MPVHPVLHIIYLFLKVLVLAAFNTFFAKTTIINRHLLRFRNPAIVVSNHPNTLQDPLNVAARVKKVVFFLANASLFKHPVANKILSTLYCIPVERAKDVKGRAVSNAKNFEKCDAFLSAGGCLYIAPEGISNPARRLNTLRTGTARIALSAENKNDFKLGLTIVPVGLNYSAPTKFRSDVLLHVGEPIIISNYKEKYEKDEFKAAKELTAELEARLATLILNTKDEQEDVLLARLQSLLQSQEPLPPAEAYLRSKQLLTALQKLRESNIEEWEEINTSVNLYFTHLSDLGIKDSSVYKYEKKRVGVYLRRNALLLLLLLPIFIYGLLNHFTANFLPALLARQLNLFVGYTATVKILAGLLTYPVIYGIQIYLVHQYFQQWPLTLLYIVSLLLTGFIVFWYTERARLFFDMWRIKFAGKAKTSNILHLRGTLFRFAKKLLSTLPGNHTSA